MPALFFPTDPYISPYIYIMAGERGYQWRFLWPIYLSFAFGFVFFFLYTFIKKYFLKNKYLFLSFFLIVNFGVILFLILPMPFQGGSVVGENEYLAYNWANENTNEFSKFLIMYSPQNSQITSLYMLKRNLFVARSETIQQIKIESTNFTLLINPEVRLEFFCKVDDCSIFQRSQFLKSRTEVKYYENKSVCDVDYIYVSLNNYEIANKVNLMYLQNLVNKNITQVIYKNQGVILTKNSIKGEECERRFKD